MQDYEFRAEMHTLEQIRDLLTRLDGQPADALESETVEFKSWNPTGRDIKARFREFRETVVAFANAGGGNLIIGVSDRARTRSEAIHGVGNLDPTSLRRDIYDGTDPHILVEVEELDEPEGRLLVVRTPRGLPPHTTTDGVAKIRVGKESKPLTGSSLAQIFVTRGGRDVTAEILPDADPSDLDSEQVSRLRRSIVSGDDRIGLVGLRDGELLDALGLTAGSNITLAAILLLGTRSALARYVPQHELVFARYSGHVRTRYDVRQDLRTPLLEALDHVQRLIEANLQLATVGTMGFQQLEIPDTTWWIVREATLNALVHRDYFLNQSIHVSLYPDQVEIVSPGGFIGGVTADNVLRHPPVRRNPLLADALQKIGFVNRAGLGVDRIYEESLLLGKDLPHYESDETHVRLVLPTRTHANFARFVSETRRRGEELELDDFIILRGLARRSRLDRWSASVLLQLSEEDAAARLMSLRERGYLVAQGRGRGASYRIASQYSDIVQGDRHMSYVRLDDEAARLRVVEAITESGYTTNAELRSILGFSRTQVLNLMRSMREEGTVEFRGRGRAAHYVLAAGRELD